MGKIETSAGIEENLIIVFTSQQIGDPRSFGSRVGYWFIQKETN